jgi:hypothetical protein
LPFVVKGIFETFFSIAKKGFKLPKKCSLSSMGRCPIPHPPFEKGGAKTFLSASPGVRLGMVVGAKWVCFAKRES